MPSKRFYLDDGHFSYREKFWKDLDVYIISGYSIGLEKEKELEHKIKVVKEKHNLSIRHPIKWNLKDTGIEKYYKERNENKLYEDMLKKSDDIRDELLKIIADQQLGIFLYASLIVRMKKKEKPLKSFQRCFTNLLQRISMHVEKTDDHHEIFLDCFKEEETSALAMSFSCGFYEGKDTEGNIYTAGALKDRGFYQTIFFSKTLYNQHLQLADLVTGCFTDFAEYCFKEKDPRKVFRFFPTIMNRFYTAKGTPFRIGIVASPDSLYAKLEKGLETIRQVIGKNTILRE